MKTVMYPYQQSYYQKNKERINAQQKIYRLKKKLAVQKLDTQDEPDSYGIFIGALVSGAIVVTPMILMALLPQYSWPIFATVLCVSMFLIVFTLVMVLYHAKRFN